MNFFTKINIEVLAAILAAVVFRVTNTKEYRKAAAIAAVTGNTNEGYTPVNDTEDE